MLDILIRGGWVVDGSGNPATRADVAIQEDRIADIGRLESAQATLTIEATGKFVCPGFVDCHSHTDSTILVNPSAESTIRQGVTTEVVGNCGGSPAPLSADTRDRTTARLRGNGYDAPIEWSSFGDLLDVVGGQGISPNLAWLVGHGTVRTAAGVSGPDATPEQMRVMKDLVREAMESGAIGMSTGLEFEPGRQARPEEIVELAKVVGDYDGFYASHTRNRDARAAEAVEECIEVVRKSGTRGEVSHLLIRHNTAAPAGTWERAVGAIEQARKDGFSVLADSTPMPLGGGSMASILPPWVREGGPAATAERLKDPEIRARLRTDCDRYWRFIHRGDWHRVRLLRSAEFPELCPKTFPEISEIMGKDPWDCYFDILAAAGAGLDGVGLVAVLYTEEHQAEVVKHPLFNLAVDGSASRIDGPLSETSRTPINFAGMIHYLTYHVRDKGNLSLEEAIRKMTSMPAGHFGLKGRGLLRTGNFADVVVFDFNQLDDASTLEQPLAYARGIEHVLVNGVQVVDAAEHTGKRPGRSLLRGSMV